MGRVAVSKGYNSMTKCGFEGCQTEILDTWEQRSGKNYIYWVDLNSPTHSFVHRHNLPGWGKDGQTMSKGSRNGSTASPELARLVLAELSDLGASKGSMAIAERLLQIASSKNSAAAVQALDRMSVRLGEKWATMQAPAPNERCKLCGRDRSGKIHITIRDTVWDEMGRLTEELQKEIASGEVWGNPNSRGEGE